MASCHRRRHPRRDGPHQPGAHPTREGAGRALRNPAAAGRQPGRHAGARRERPLGKDGIVMEVMHRYKQAEIEVIPEDWEIKPIGELVSISVGGDIKGEHFLTYQDDIFKYPVFSNTVANEGLYGFSSISEYDGKSLTV